MRSRPTRSRRDLARPRPWRTLALTAVTGLLTIFGCAGESAGPEIGDGSTVALQYTLTLNDGTKVEDNTTGEPLVVKIGAEEILPGVEQALMGMRAEGTTQVSLTPEEAYGFADPNALQVVPIADVPEEAREEGRRLIARDNEGNQRPIRVHRVDAEEVVLDFNHPLAGETLHFDLRVVEVQP